LAATVVLAEATPQLRHYLRFVRREAWLILLVPAVALGLAYAVVSRQHSVYRASMGILVAQGGGAFQPQLGNQALTQTMTNILKSDVIAQRVVAEMHLPMTSSDLLKKLRVQVNPDSSVLNVSYDSENRQEGLKILTQVGKSFKALVREELGISGNLKKPGPLLIVADVFNPPHLEPHRVSPQPGRVYGFAVGLGLALGFVLAFARESIDDRVRGRLDAEKWFGAPVIGALPRGFRGNALAGGVQNRHAQAAQALQLLRANLQLRLEAMGPTLLVASPHDREGKTTVVANLGMALALAGQEVICVESDVRRPSLHQLLGISERVPGLVDVLERRIELEDALREVELARLSVNGSTSTVGRELGGRLRLLPAGAPPSDPTAVMSRERTAELVQELSKRASYVIFDSPPLLAAGEVLPLALAVDSVLLVARQGRTTREGAEALRTTLEGLGVRRLAIVLMNARERVSAYTYR
jgi:capsular polysaccharide biosynthesis protein/Mrp family chromosome partitioning ATPase